MDARTRLRLSLLLLWAPLVVLTTACGGATDPSAAGSGGDAAVWVLAPDQDLGSSSTKFTALVSRLGCNNGVTGEVLEPEIRISESEVVVTFSVAPEQRGPAACPGNDQVPYEVDLGEPVGDRALVDGRCLPDQTAASTSFCEPDATRFRP